MSTTTCSYDVEIEAPDGAAAVELERRLWHLAPTTVLRGKVWVVEVPTATSLDEVEVIVRAWLDDLGQPSVTIRSDGHVREIECHRSPFQRTRHFDFIG